MEAATRYSPKREAILQCLRSTKCHPSAEWVYTQLKPQIPDLSLATVYRNLNYLADHGEIRRITVSDSKDRFDPTLVPHEHAICRVCGKMRDVETGDLRAYLRSENRRLLLRAVHS